MEKLINNYKLFLSIKINEKYNKKIFNQNLKYIEYLNIFSPVCIASFFSTFLIINFLDSVLFLQVIFFIIFYIFSFCISYIGFLFFISFFFNNFFKEKIESTLNKLISEHPLKKHLVIKPISKFSFLNDSFDSYYQELVNSLNLKNINTVDFLITELKEYDEKDIILDYQIIFDIFDKNQETKKEKDKFFDFLFNKFKVSFEKKYIDIKTFHKIIDYVILNTYDSLDDIVEKRNESEKYFNLLDNVYNKNNKKNSNKELSNVNF